MTNRWNVDRIMRFFLVAGAVAFLIVLLNYLSGVLAPFFAAFIIAYIFNPFVNLLHKKFHSRILAVITVIFSGIGLVTLAGWLFIPRLIREIHLLGVWIAKFFTEAEWGQKVMEFIPKDLWSAAKHMVSWDKLSEMMRTMDFWNGVQVVASKVLSGSIGVLSGTATVLFWLVSVVMIVIYMAFIMLDMPKLRKGLANLVPTRYRENIVAMAHEMDRFMGSYFRSQALVALVVGLLFAIAFMIFGLPMGVMFGVFIGALNMVPYLQLLSIPVALLLGIIYSIDSGMPFWQVALILTGIYVVIQLLQDLVLVPTIVGKTMNLPPVGILLSLSVWGKLLGFLGLIVAIPFTCLCLVYLQRISNKNDEFLAPLVGNPDKNKEKN